MSNVLYIGFLVAVSQSLLEGGGGVVGVCSIFVLLWLRATCVDFVCKCCSYRAKMGFGGAGHRMVVCIFVSMYIMCMYNIICVYI